MKVRLRVRNYDWRLMLEIVDGVRVSVRVWGTVILCDHSLALLGTIYGGYNTVHGITNFSSMRASIFDIV